MKAYTKAGHTVERRENKGPTGHGPCGGHCDGPASYNEAQLVSSRPIGKLLCHSRSPPPEPLLVLATFDGEFTIHTVSEGSWSSPAYIIYIQIGVNDFDRVPRTNASARSPARGVLRG